ncbi:MULTISPECIES: ATP-dependent RNA helicase HrpA [Pseudoalteromonas]|uniref:ATP-dependent RNA helicase HrpA n=2 Tax=Pseudoalteromonas TaxID=53246 RepID=A0ABT6U149_9GAMM|nr:MULTISPECIES: ATP-dependent RNA helicase HrpA [Pseudoalteromonas]NUJ32085.1 ATP-dependent RNA helicase HrpA [Pseudoalteromonas sp. 2103]KPV96379.1 ATP-dependent RNA helicase HrpB [Pseudoalteromonas sp. P1-8]MDI4669902.1 ATP-dependent RNA helicase HrpA [Pseudoalteromonas shioyasakiensis]MDI4671961.1 ATP-dependent RNA helicase HrpA [Pseudoalteromonas shioyasakiensis]MDI4686817.1 ATP-dependent RNA helicase HrpA [Pseudoalteromonas shioyasakiensis]
MVNLGPLFGELKTCLRKDQFIFKKRLHGIKKINDETKQANIAQKIAEDISRSQQLREQRLAALPKVTYPEQLPVSQKKDDIKQAIANNQVVIIAGETGSGKTTQIPKMCLELGRGVDGYIGHTQPRRLAARSVANRIAEEMQCELGQQVGFKIRFSDQVSDNSYIKLMTDGILLAEIQQDRYLNQYDTIIIDEAHERSLNIDFILGYLKNLLPKRPDLKVIITSATIDPERFSKHFDDAPIIEVSGRTFPVEVRYRPTTEINKDEMEADGDQLQGIFDAVDELCDEGPGDILIFMNGEREIRDTADALSKRNLKGTDVLPLYSRLSNAEQNRIFAPHSRRHIILATNVAETSLTVPGIRYVIDPGTARISRYSYRTKVQRLPIEPISQASANQRKGRCGRIEAGICIRLYSEEDFNSRPEFTDPEILRTNLASVILQMLGLGLGDMQQFPFVQAPDSRNINDGLTLLEELEAIKPAKRHKKTELTKSGRSLSRLPVDPRLAKMVLTADGLGALREVIIIVAALSIQDPRERPQEKRGAADEKHGRFDDPDSDFIAFLNLWNYLEEQQSELSNSQFRKLCQKDFLAYMRIREWQDIVYQLSTVCNEMGMKATTNVADSERIHQSLLSGMLSHIGFKDEKQIYKGARNSQFHIFPGSGLFKKSPKWIMSAELVETSKLYARINARIDLKWVEGFAQHLVKRSYSEPHWEKKPGAVIAFEQQTLYGLLIVNKRRCVYSNIDPKVSRELFIRTALVEQELGQNEGFLQYNQELIEDIQVLENKSRRRDILVDEQTLFEFYDKKIPQDVNNRAAFNKWWKGQKQKDKRFLHMSREELMQHGADHVTEFDYPDTWQQENLLLPLAYHFDPGQAVDGVAVQIPVALLNQVQETGFDWHIPAFRHELICALIKSLPKTIRRNFVPAPNYADAVLAAIEPMQGNLIDAISTRLLRMTGVRVEPDAWDLSTLAPHLRLQFEVRDEHDKLLARGLNLSKLKAQLQGKVTDTLSKVADKGIEKADLTEWSFGELPSSYVKKQGQYEIKAFPALVDKKDSAAVELFDNEHKAQQAHQQGLRRLVLLNVPSPIKYLQQNLPNKSKLGLYFNPFGKVNDLIDDCIAAAVDSLLTKYGNIRTADAFEKAKEQIRGELGDTVVEIATQVEQVLSIAHGLNKRMKGRVDLTMITAHGDIKSQLQSLVFKGFVSQHGAAKMTDLIRYLKAIERRLEKLPVDPNRDRLCVLELEKVAEQYQKLANKIPKGMPIPEEISAIFWMQQELRVSLFAQTLGTPYPVSAKRVLNAIKECEL